MNDFTVKKQLSNINNKFGDIFSIEQLKLDPYWQNKRISEILARWIKNGWIIRIKRGTYKILPIDIDFEHLGEPLILSMKLFGSNSYIGGWSALEHWHFTDQIFNSVCVLTTKRFRNKDYNLHNIKFNLNKIDKSKLYGIKKIWIDNQMVLISDPSKTIIDILSNPAIGGSIELIIASFKAYCKSEFLDENQLIDYCKQHSNKTLYKRLGFLSSKIIPQCEKLINFLTQNLSKGHSQIYPGLEGKKLITKWRLFIPDSINKELK